jgi:hypothetical protein
MRDKLVANMQLNFAVICPENFVVKCAKSLRQRHKNSHGKNSAGRGKITAKCHGIFVAKFHGKPKCRLPQLCREIAMTFSELLQIIFCDKSRGKLTNTL